MSQTQILPESSPTVTCKPLGVQDTRFNAGHPSTTTLAVGTSVS
ncbi:GSCOCG00006500001-RA-CDS, partial [Cotesia congregata]